MVEEMARPKGTEPHGVNVGTRVPPDLYDWFVKVAEAGDRTLSRQVFIAMREYRERHEETVTEPGPSKGHPLTLPKPTVRSRGK